VLKEDYKPRCYVELDLTQSIVVAAAAAAAVKTEFVVVTVAADIAQPGEAIEEVVQVLRRVCFDMMWMAEYRSGSGSLEEQWKLGRSWRTGIVRPGMALAAVDRGHTEAG